jgi:hypothetical protein
MTESRISNRSRTFLQRRDDPTRRLRGEVTAVTGFANWLLLLAQVY